MAVFVFGTGVVTALGAVCFSLYMLAYALLRLRGTLAVTGGGWQAGTLSAYGILLASAYSVLRIFEPAMRLEARLCRVPRVQAAAQKPAGVGTSAYGSKIPVQA